MFQLRTKKLSAVNTLQIRTRPWNTWWNHFAIKMYGHLYLARMQNRANQMGFGLETGQK